MKNLKIFCLDVTKYTNTSLLESLIILGENNNCVFDTKSILGCKSKNFAKIYIDMISGDIIAYTTVGDDQISYTNEFKSIVISVDPVNIPVTRKEKVEEKLDEVIKNALFVDDSILDVDSILEKIGKYGIKSLTDNEKKFLDNSNI